MEPTITDWISAIGVLLGVPAALFGIMKLFVKDREKQRQLMSLESMASSQSRKIEELEKQTAEIQYQSTLMKESNELLANQLQLQSEIFIYQKVSDESKKMIEDRKRKIDIRPHFNYNGGVSNAGWFSIKLLNKGSIAENVDMKLIDCEHVQFNRTLKRKYEHDAILEIKGSAKSESNLSSNKVSFTAKLEFQDMDGNVYNQIIKRNNGSVIIENPIEKAVK